MQQTPGTQQGIKLARFGHAGDVDLAADAGDFDRRQELVGVKDFGDASGDTKAHGSYSFVFRLLSGKCHHDLT